VGGARPTQPVTLYMTVNITPEEAPIQFPVADPFSPLLHYPPVETGPTTTMPGHIQFPVPETYRSNMWEETVERIKLVMDILGPIAEVRVMPF
jgi:hypothetical protein